MPTFYTTGYQEETSQSFIAKLTAVKISLLIDVRQNPFSFKKGFSRSQLESVCSESDINYVHIKELGTPTPLRNYLKATGDYIEFFSGYSNFLSEYGDLVEDLILLSKQTKVCILCFEKDYHMCHRQVISKRVQELSGNMFNLCHL